MNDACPIHSKPGKDPALHQIQDLLFLLKGTKQAAQTLNILDHLAIDAMPATRRSVIDALFDIDGWEGAGAIATAARLPSNSDV